jgi:RNA-directed DNA polymerase
MSKTLNKNQTVEWSEINWRKAERLTFKLQKRIFQASERGDVKAVRKLQKTLINSWSAKCIAVRRVTQDNSGKNTAGVDGVKSLTPKQRINLIGKLKLTGKVKPTRRVYIPKPGTTETPPQAPRTRGVWGGGIPTINDRALQALVKLALEPEWEAKFEPNSYGFRPGSSCHDAIEAIYISINHKAKYVLDADDFVIIHEDLKVITKSQEIIANWLNDMGLELKPSKTKLTHTLKKIDGNVGFEFLGFHIQQHKVGNYRCANNSNGTPLGFSTLQTLSRHKNGKRWFFN